MSTIGSSSKKGISSRVVSYPSKIASNNENIFYKQVEGVLIRGLTSVRIDINVISVKINIRKDYL